MGKHYHFFLMKCQETTIREEMLDGEEAVAKVAALKERENAKGDAANALM